MTHRDAPRTPRRPQTHQERRSEAEDAPGTSEGHSADTSERSPWCAFGAPGDVPPDLAKLAELWLKLPEETRAAIITLAKGAARE